MYDHNFVYYADQRQITVHLYRSLENLIFKPLGLIQSSGFLGVVIFFLISGYIITYILETETTAEFAIKRFFRIFPPFWFSILAVIVLYALPSMITRVPNYFSQYTVRDYFGSGLLLNYFSDGIRATNAGAWTLAIEVTFYLFMAMLSPIKRQPILTITVFGLVYGMVAALSYAGIGFFRHIDNVLYYLPILFVGVVLRYMEIGLSFKTGILAFIALYLLFLANTHVLGNDYLFPGYMSSILVAFIVFYTCMMNAKAFTGRMKPIYWIADQSYSLYLLHFTIGYFVMDKLSAEPYSVRLLAGISAIFVVSAVFKQLVERPSVRLGSRIARLVRGEAQA